jgi:regulatory protein
MSIEKAKSHALKYLAYRPRSIQEVKDYLESKKYDKQIITEVIKYLIDLSYLDDDKFCQAWIESRCRFKPKGQKGLRYELRNKGIDNSLIEKSLAENFPPETELEIAKNLITRKFLAKNRSSSQEKVMAFLYRRGFSKDIIHKALHHWETSNSS